MGLTDGWLSVGVTAALFVVLAVIVWWMADFFGVSKHDVIARANAEDSLARLKQREAWDRQRLEVAFPDALRAALSLEPGALVPEHLLLRLDGAGAEFRVHLDGQGPRAIDAEVLRRKLSRTWEVCESVEAFEDPHLPADTVVKLQRLHAVEPPPQGVAE